MFSPAVESIIRLVMYGLIFVLVIAGLQSVLTRDRSKNNRKLTLVDEAKAPLIEEKKAAEPLPVKKKRPLTEREKPMFPRLVSAFPNHIVLTQVAFSAIITHERQDWATDRATRSKFNRMVVDFVICTKEFDVLAVIELDDSTHDGREDRDASRDALLQTAGYKVFRYRQIPDVLRLRQDITPDEATSGEPSRVANIETA
ncbi:hypothetical protein UNDYM_2584 [Undibacterium sp. YM2]|uniref:DUF2726 domain-containing protein n=1 Tax=Undibacterium sp. YM2 TaxID=2058625 RepID=UPI001331D037|nr:DUF2726 domain-containing protein [Undibacterium sp. YM2]BBB66837.1 hypothetical protein UNDYM_2584 [Undibacterium sp. YM2]